MAHIFQAIIKLFKPNKGNTGEPFISSGDFSRLYKPNKTFDEEFYSNLCKTIRWTTNIIRNIGDASSIDYSTILRQINPMYNGRPFYDFSCKGSPAPPVVSFDYNYILQEALAPRDNINLNLSEFDLSGRILVFKIDITTYDGAPVANSEGFVDEADIPPIDTWFYITKEYLYCWIPDMFISVMQDAIDVEIFGSYEWLQDINAGLNKQVLQEVKHRLIL